MESYCEKVLEKFSTFNKDFIKNYIVPKLWEKLTKYEKDRWITHKSLQENEKKALYNKIPSILSTADNKNIFYYITHLLQDDCNYGYIIYMNKCVPLYSETGMEVLLEWVVENKKLFTPYMYETIVNILKEEYEKYTKVPRNTILYTALQQINRL